MPPITVDACYASTRTAFSNVVHSVGHVEGAVLIKRLLFVGYYEIRFWINTRKHVLTAVVVLITLDNNIVFVGANLDLVTFT